MTPERAASATGDEAKADYAARPRVDHDFVVALHVRHADGLGERRGVRDTERTEGRCDQDEDAGDAACGFAEVASSWRFTTDDLMHALMRKS